VTSVEGRVAVVTGAAFGIGLGMVRAFAAGGMRAVAADVRKEALDEVNSTSPHSAEGDQLATKMAQALTSGMEPDEVGRLVLDAILHDQFWIFTDPTLLRHVQEQVDVMVTDHSLTRLRLL
jgi:NAD(P)-dependent dehydrogenase (short-subunit alcohol dehydrogenase family)